MENWSELRKGNKQALENLYREHAEVLIRYGMKVCGDMSVVEDCLQNLFITIWEKRENLGDTTSARNYLLASLRRSIYRYKDKRSVSTDPQELRASDHQVEDTFEDLMIKGEMDDEQKARFKEALSAISARQREVIYLRYYEDKEYEEICEIMDITYQGARNMLFKALRSLRDKLAWMIFIFFEWVTESVFQT